MCVLVKKEKKCLIFVFFEFEGSNHFISGFGALFLSVFVVCVCDVVYVPTVGRVSCFGCSLDWWGLNRRGCNSDHETWRGGGARKETNSFFLQYMLVGDLWALAQGEHLLF